VCPRSKKTRLGSLALALGLLTATCFGGACGEATSESASPTTTPTKPGAAYSVFAVHADPADGPTCNVVTYRVLVAARTTPDMLEAITQEIIDKAKSGRPFRLLWIEFSDYEQFAANGATTVGRARYGPPPKQVTSVTPGYWAAMSLRTWFPAKAWSRQPSAEQVAVWAMWAEFVARGQGDGAACERQVAEQLDIRPQTVRRIVRRCDRWTMFPLVLVW
jgi:hypothetical protein